jgi:hypothetical protein
MINYRFDKGDVGGIIDGIALHHQKAVGTAEEVLNACCQLLLGTKNPHFMHLIEIVKML